MNRYSYTAFPSNQDKKFRPLVFISFKRGEHLSPKLATIADSGSDRTISYVAVAKLLGVDFSDAANKQRAELWGYNYKEEIEGLTGKMWAFNIPLKITLDGREDEIKISWLDANFDATKDFPVILGQDWIFYYYRICFDKQERIFTLAPVSCK